MKTRGGYKHMTNKNRRLVTIKDVFRESSHNKIKEFNEYHMLVYAGTQLFYMDVMGHSFMSLNHLYHIMNIENNVRAKNNIKNAFLDLIEMGLIMLDNPPKKTNNNSPMEISIPFMAEDRFTQINKDFVYQILSSDHQITKKGNLLLVYSLLAQYTGNNTMSYPSTQTLAKELNMSRKTISGAIAELQKMSIIVYDNTKSKNKNGHFVRANNIYVFCDEEDPLKILKYYVSKHEKDKKNNQ